MKETFVGICGYCGQTVMVDNVVETGDGAEPVAEMYCSCEKALRHQRLHRAHMAIDEVCVRQAEAAGFEVFSEDRVNRIKAACESLVDGSVDKTAFSFDGGDNVLLWLKDASIMVKRTRKLELKMKG